MQQKSTAKLVVCIVGTVVFALLGIRNFVSLVQDLGYIIEGYGGVLFLLRDLVGVSWIFGTGSRNFGARPRQGGQKT